jgi:hypothetical protein
MLTKTEIKVLKIPFNNKATEVRPVCRNIDPMQEDRNGIHDAVFREKPIVRMRLFEVF